MGKERPIIFSVENVEAILDGRKTMTRRTNRLDEINQYSDDWLLSNHQTGDIWVFLRNDTGEPKWIQCPYGQVGDRLWVRETWMPFGFVMNNGIFIHYKASINENGGERLLQRPTNKTYEIDHKWRPSIFMPRWASRLTLEITGVRAERLQEIDYFGARAEGILSFNREHPDPTNGGMGYNRGKAGLPMRYDSTAAFMDLWDSLNAKRGYGWEINPWCWVISFRRAD